MNQSVMENNLFNGKKKALISITYNSLPNFCNITLALSTVDYAIIVDNGSSEEILSDLERYSADSERVFLIKNGKNLGISKAYNRAVEFCRTIDVYWLFFFDSDANYSLSYFVELSKCWIESSGKGIKIGIVSPIVGDIPDLIGIQWKKDVSFVSSVITSGIMTNTEVFEDVGGYDENYFLELADLAFCRRVLKKDYSIIRLNKILISQTFGLTVSEKYPMISAFNFISSISSRIRLRNNSSNVYRTRYPVYGEVRLNQYYENYSKLTESNGISEIQSKLYLFILKKINCYLKRKIKETR